MALKLIIDGSRLERTEMPVTAISDLTVKPTPMRASARR